MARHEEMIDSKTFVFFVIRKQGQMAHLQFHILCFMFYETVILCRP
jgi:hypothetical protein